MGGNQWLRFYSIRTIFSWTLETYYDGQIFENMDEASRLQWQGWPQTFWLSAINTTVTNCPLPLMKTWKPTKMRKVFQKLADPGDDGSGNEARQCQQAKSGLRFQTVVLTCVSPAKGPKVQAWHIASFFLSIIPSPSSTPSLSTAADVSHQPLPFTTIRTCTIYRRQWHMEIIVILNKSNEYRDDYWCYSNSWRLWWCWFCSWSSSWWWWGYYDWCIHKRKSEPSCPTI